MVVREVRAEDHGRRFSERSMMLVDIIPKNAFGAIVEDFFASRFQRLDVKISAFSVFFGE
jgi:hypothetical protein